MPKLARRTPKYRRHPGSGQALVVLNGQSFYLGRWGTATSRQAYDELIARWLANDRQVPEDDCSMVVVELTAAYWKFARGYYVKNGRPTDELASIRVALKFLKNAYGRTRAAGFGPLALKVVRQHMIDAGHSRGYINGNVGRIKRVFRWAVEQEMVPVGVHQALLAVRSLSRGRTEARETEPVGPVSDETVEATLLHVRPEVAAMVKFQRWTGCRPAEVCLLRPCDLDRSDEVWQYVPQSHKTEHRGRARAILVGPRAQVVILPYLLRDAGSYCFRQCRGRRDRHTPSSYRAAIHRAASRAGVPKCNPNQLRHSAATEIRQKYGLEAAQVALGHASADITQVYAERDLALAAKVAREIG